MDFITFMINSLLNKLNVSKNMSAKFEFSFSISTIDALIDT